jgi:hypothetical protein
MIATLDYGRETIGKYHYWRLLRISDFTGLFSASFTTSLPQRGASYRGATQGGLL